MTARPSSDAECEVIHRKYLGSYVAGRREHAGPELLAQMTPVEAMVILEYESQALYDGSAVRSNPAVGHAWEVMWTLAEGAG